LEKDGGDAKNEEVVLTVNEKKRNIPHTIKRRSLTGLFTCCVGNVF